MSNHVPCPNCETEIDATAVALTGFCPECDASFVQLVDIATGTDSDPEDAGPFYEVEP
jgi:Zn finger protein HypA/HybF involved in hydrogenase expression